MPPELWPALGGKQNKLAALLECFCQVFGQNPLALLDGPEVALPFLRLFYGAMASPTFIDDCRATSVYARARKIKKMVGDICSPAVADAALAESHFSSVHTTPYQERCRLQFEALKDDPYARRMWTGWRSKNLTGTETWFPLFGVARTYGLLFADELHGACANFFSTHRAQQIPGLNEFLSFLECRKPPLEDLRDPIRCSAIWTDLMIYFFETKISSTRVDVLTSSWDRTFLPFLDAYLFAPNILARPNAPMPRPPLRKVREKSTHVGMRDGVLCSVKLITEIPLEIKDEAAADQLAKKIQLEANLIDEWASREVADLNRRVQRRLQLAATGLATTHVEKTVLVGRRWRLHRSNPDWLANAAATYSLNGHLPPNRVSQTLGLLYPPDLGRVAYELGIPTTRALLPHCSILVLEHPEITPSFLENFELYDKDGRRSGVVSIDGRMYLDGRKSRKGAQRGQQIIELSARAATVVIRIIQATNPLRRYLKRIGNPNWRYLLLSAGKGFGVPAPIRRLATLTSNPKEVATTAQQLAENESRYNHFDLAMRFSLPRLRAQKGVLIYLTTRSVRAMAKALGHTNYHPNLLRHYLPAALEAYFRDRWVLTFQMGILLQAMHGSPLLLRASRMRSMTEVGEFLNSHALKSLEDNVNLQEVPPPQSSRVLVSIDSTILAALFSIRSAVNDCPTYVNPNAKLWSDFSVRLEDAILASGDRTFTKAMNEARLVSDPSRFSRIVAEPGA